jgi:O-antigen ligase
MYVRLLAETGLIGFFVFVAFLFSVLGDALQALQSKTAMGRYLGIAGIFSWFAIALYNVTQDSFATPNIWINFGILVGMTVYPLPASPKSNDENLEYVSSNNFVGFGEGAREAGGGGEG